MGTSFKFEKSAERDASEGKYFCIAKEPDEILERLIKKYAATIERTPTTGFEFENKMSDGFDISLHLSKLAVINQTTMLASETSQIAAFFKEILK